MSQYLCRIENICKLIQLAYDRTSRISNKGDDHSNNAHPKLEKKFDKESVIQLIQTCRDVVEFLCRKETNSLLTQNRKTFPHIKTLLRFLENIARVLTDEGIKDDYKCDLILCMMPEKGTSSNLSTKDKLCLMCLNPKVIFGDVCSMNYRSIILTSSNIFPVSLFEEELDIKFPIKQATNPAPLNSQIMVGALCKCIKGISVDFSWKNRDNGKLFQEFGETIIDLVKIIPGGILIFFPSFLMVGSLMKIWSLHSIFNQIKKYKNVYIETNSKGDTKRSLENYENDINNSKGAIFIGVSRGHAVHNFSFSDNAARCVIIAGLPFGPRTDIKRNLIMSSMNQKHKNKLSKMNGDVCYISLSLLLIKIFILIKSDKFLIYSL